jgi:hypothetical protein
MKYTLPLLRHEGNVLGSEPWNIDSLYDLVVICPLHRDKEHPPSPLVVFLFLSLYLMVSLSYAYVYIP